MRHLLPFARLVVPTLVAVVASCGGGTGGPAGNNPDGATGPTADAPIGPPSAGGFQIKTPDIQIPAGEEITYCYYLHTPNTSDVIVSSWASYLAPGSHHMILYFQSDNGSNVDGTLDPSGNCGAGGASINDLPVWTYSSSQSKQVAAMPADDGTGTPVGMKVPANQAAVIQLHYINTTEGPLTASTTINANAYPSGTTYTPAAAFVTYQDSIDIPPGPSTTQVSFGGTCATPVGAKFFTMSTHSHKQSVMTQVMDGSTMVQTSNNWETPTLTTWDAAPFYQFASNSLSYQCTYVNPTSNEIVSGPSAQTNEMCMAIGYFFPATAPKLCVTVGGQSYEN